MKKFEQGTVLTDGKKYWLCGADNKAHPIEVSNNIDHFDLDIWTTEPTYVISNEAVTITKNMKPITDIVELTTSVQLIPKNKAVVAHSVFKQGYYDLEDPQLHYDMQKPYVISLTEIVSSMVKSYGFVGATQHSALHIKPLSDLDCWDYDYATVGLYGVVRALDDVGVVYRASSMILTAMEDYRLVLKEAVGNKGIDNASCAWVVGCHNVRCNSSQYIYHCENTSYSFMSSRLTYCNKVTSCDLCVDCRWSSSLTCCINVRYGTDCVCCHDVLGKGSLLFNKRASCVERSLWKRYIENSKAETWADLYEALSYDKIRHLIRRKAATITAKDVSAFRKHIKPYC